MTSRCEISRIASHLERYGVLDDEHELLWPLPTTM